jgi:hypothetical protein
MPLNGLALHTKATASIAKRQFVGAMVAAGESARRKKPLDCEGFDKPILILAWAAGQSNKHIFKIGFAR